MILNLNLLINLLKNTYKIADESELMNFTDIAGVVK